jgi:hypothetical protein
MEVMGRLSKGAEKVYCVAERFPQRLKPQRSDGSYGATKVAPLQNNDFSAPRSGDCQGVDDALELLAYVRCKS